MGYSALFHFLLPHRLALTMGALLMIGESIATLATPWLAGLYAKHLLGTNVESGVGETNSIVGIAVGGDSLTLLFMLWLLVLVAQALFKFGSSYLVTTSGAKILTNLSDRLYQYIQSLPMAFFQNHKRGDLLALFSNDIAIISHFFTGTLISTVPTLITMVGALLLIAMIDQYVALLTVLVIPGFFIIAKILGRKIRSVSEMLVQKQAASLALTEENLSLISIIKAFNRERLEVCRYQQRMSDVLNQRKELLTLQSVLSPVIQLLASMGVLLILWVCAQQMRMTQLSTAQLISLLLYGLLFARPVSHLANFYGQAQQAFGASKRLRSVFAMSPESLEQNARAFVPAKGEINFSGVVFCYSGRPPIFNQLRLLIKAGETVAITGENGVGKTTLLKLLMRFTDPKQGTIKIDGQDIQRVSLPSLRKHLGYVSQETLLYDGTVADNIRYGLPGACQADIEAVARSTCVHDFVLRLPDGYQTTVGEMGVKLSGGQRQRIALARALIRKPKILLLDEATSMFDPLGEQEFVEKARDLFAEHTVILVAHSRASLALADRVLKLHNGQLTEVTKNQHERDTMTTYQIPEELLLQTVADETVILDPDSGNYFTLDSVGSRLIALFRENNSIQKTVDKMAEEYQSARDIIYADLVALLDDMVRHGLAVRT